MACTLSQEFDNRVHVQSPHAAAQKAYEAYEGVSLAFLDRAVRAYSEGALENRASVLLGFIDNLTYLYRSIITISTSLYRSGDGDDRKGGAEETSSG